MMGWINDEGEFNEETFGADVMSLPPRYDQLFVDLRVDGREGWFKYLPRLLFFPAWLRPSLRSRLEPVPPRWWKSGERTQWWTSRWPSSCSRFCWWSGASTSRRRLTRWWSWAWRWPATSASRRSSTSRAQNLDEDNDLLNPKVLQGFRQCSYPGVLWGKSRGR